MKLHSFKNLLIEELRDLYDAEKQLIKILPSLADGAVLPELKTVFVDHLEETEGHLRRLEDILHSFRESPLGNPCKTMKGLIEECEDLLREQKKADPGVLEAAIIGAAQKVEHWEIAAYGCARTYAQILGLTDVAHLLQTTLDEEGVANRKLNEIAMQSVNPEAADATSEEKRLKEAVVSVLEVSR